MLVADARMAEPLERPTPHRHRRARRLDLRVPAFLTYNRTALRRLARLGQPSQARRGAAGIDQIVVVRGGFVTPLMLRLISWRPRREIAAVSRVLWGLVARGAFCASGTLAACRWSGGRRPFCPSGGAQPADRIASGPAMFFHLSLVTLGTGFCFGIGYSRGDRGDAGCFVV